MKVAKEFNKGRNFIFQKQTSPEIISQLYSKVGCNFLITHSNVLLDVPYLIIAHSSARDICSLTGECVFLKNKNVPRAWLKLSTVFCGITHTQAFIVREVCRPFSVQDHFSETSGWLLMWLRSFSSRAPSSSFFSSPYPTPSLPLIKWRK